MEERHVPMYKVITRLVLNDFPLGEVDAVELFAREGDWQTIVYAPRVKSLEVWEINPEFYDSLKKNLPNAKIKITDTWKEIKETTRKYDLIAVDAPNSNYGENDEHCEHFGLLPDIFRIASDGCVIVLNVNMEPYDLHKNLLWRKRRVEYYKTETPGELDFHMVVQRYRDICRENGIEMQWHFFQQRHRGFMYYFVMRIRK